MAQTPHLTGDEARKAELISELAASREELALTLRETLHDLNVVERLRHSITHRKTAWFTGAALTGGLLSWIFGRKKKKKPVRKPLPPAKFEIPQNSYLGLALAVATFAFKAFKPLLSRIASRKIAQFAEHN